MFDVELRLKPLVLRAQAGDAAAWREVLRTLETRLSVYFARRIGVDGISEVEDLVQETLLAVHGRRMTYDAGQPFTAWAHAVARYKLVDFWRRRGVRRHAALEDVADALWIDSEAEGAARVDVDRLLAGLPDRQGRLVRDVKLDGLSLAEAGARQGMTEGAAKVSLHRAMKALMSKVVGRED